MMKQNEHIDENGEKAEQRKFIDGLNPYDMNEQTITIQTLEPQAVSIQPSILEIERFITYLNNRFEIKPSNELIILIQKTEPQTKGYYSPNSWRVFKHKSKEQEPKNINEITLSSLYLCFEPYETIAHEYAHFLNTYLDKYKGNFRNYHTLDFKKRAEQLLLRVEKGNYGYNQTFETPAFKEMLEDFKPDETAFKIFQPSDSRIVGFNPDGKPIDIDGNIIKPKPKGNSRLILFECDCKIKIRTARNEKKPLKAICQYCNSEFKEVIKDGEKPKADGENDKKGTQTPHNDGKSIEPSNDTPPKTKKGICQNCEEPNETLLYRVKDGLYYCGDCMTERQHDKAFYDNEYNDNEKDCV